MRTVRSEPSDGGALALLISIESRCVTFVIQMNRDDPRYCLPGGNIEPGELPAEAAAREAREETGIPVDAGQLILLSAERRTGSAYYPWLYLGVVEEEDFLKRKRYVYDGAKLLETRVAGVDQILEMREILPKHREMLVSLIARAQ